MSASSKLYTDFLTTARISQIQSSIRSAETAELAMQARYVDTVAVAKEKGERSPSSPANRCPLPNPGKSSNPQYLDVIARAFADAFMTMGDSVTEQTRDFAKTQTFNQMNAQFVLTTTQKSIDAQTAEMTINDQVQQYQKQVQAQNDTIGTVFFWVGIALVAITLVSAVVDFGSSLSAVPEEMEMIEMTEIPAAVSDSTSGTADSVASAGTEEEEDVDESAAASQENPEASGAQNEENVEENAATQNRENEIQQDTQRTVNRDSTQTTRQANRAQDRMTSIKQGLKDKSLSFAKFGLKCVIGGIFGIPQLIQAISNFNLHTMLKNVSDTQSQVGAALANMQTSNLYFQFSQQVVQQSGGVLNEEASDASNVLETYSDIVSTYRQIPQGLANAV